MKDLCSKYGFNGLYPLDNEAPRSLAGSELALWIYRANIALIQKADLVAANMNAFRGAEPDSGTAFEVGYAVALGKPEIGRASGRERVCQCVEISGVALSLKKKREKTHRRE